MTGRPSSVDSSRISAITPYISEEHVTSRGRLLKGTAKIKSMLAYKYNQQARNSTVELRGDRFDRDIPSP